EGRGGRLEREPGDHHGEADDDHRVALVPDRRDPVERELPRRAVDERRAEEQRRRADRADDEVLQTRLERPDQVDVDRRQHVERDREPLEPEEERHQVRRLDEERHPGACGGEQRVVLGDVLVAHPLAVGEEHGDGAGAREDHLGERRPAVAEDRVVDDRRPGRRLRVDDHREREGDHEAREADQGGERLADDARRQHRDHQQEPGGADERERRRDGEPVDVRLLDHLPPPVSTATNACCPPTARSETSAGQAERPIRQRISGTTTASSPGRRSSALSGTAGPTSWWRTAEIARSMYIAASTIATPPTTAQPHPWRKTPARIRNSPAKELESGTASEMIPIVITTVASAGRPRAIPPSSRNSPVDVRRSTMPATRNSVAEISAWLTIWSTAPSNPRSLKAKIPSTIRPACASDEYITTPRKSGARNASSDP